MRVWHPLAIVVLVGECRLALGLSGGPLRGGGLGELPERDGRSTKRKEGRGQAEARGGALSEAGRPLQLRPLRRSVRVASRLPLGAQRLSLGGCCWQTRKPWGPSPEENGSTHRHGRPKNPHTEAFAFSFQRTHCSLCWGPGPE